MPDDDQDDGFDQRVGSQLQERFKENSADDSAAEPESVSTGTAQEPQRGGAPDVSGEDVVVPGDTPVREWDQYTMLLPPELAEALDRRFERLNAERTLDDKETLSKNSDYNIALVRFLLAEMDDEDLLQYAGIEE